MAITREKKEALFITDYRGLKVPEIQELRAKIREADGSYLVVKNTLARRALEDAGLPQLDEMLTGPVAISFCHQNIPGVAKAVTDFAKANEALSIRGGLMGQQIIDVKAVESLADLPSIDVLRAQILGLLNAPASQLVGVVSGGVRQLVNVFNVYAEEAEQDAGSEPAAENAEQDAGSEPAAEDAEQDAGSEPAAEEDA